MRNRRSKRAILGAAAMTMLFAGSAFTASNTMPATSDAGVGTTAITGYDVTNIQYQSVGSDIIGATMDVDKDVSTASARRIQFTHVDGVGASTTGPWHECDATTAGTGTTEDPYVYGLDCPGAAETAMSEDAETFDDITVVITD